jgi:protein-S-isoprenylcysteine O-methyltransferase Ste14
MNNEFPFQIVGIALFVTAMSMSISFRSRANRAGTKAGDRITWQGEGTVTRIGLRVAGPAMWLGLVAYLINPGWMKWSQLPLPAAVRWAGALLAALAVPLMFWMFRSLGLNITETVAIRREHQLVTHGPYRWIRHPLYAFGSLLFIGLTVLTANWFIAAAAVIGGFFLGARTLTEEARLVDRFGDEYRQYMQRTGRFFPRLAAAK